MRSTKWSALAVAQIAPRASGALNREVVWMIRAYNELDVDWRATSTTPAGKLSFANGSAGIVFGRPGFWLAWSLGISRMPLMFLYTRQGPSSPPPPYLQTKISKATARAQSPAYQGPISILRYQRTLSTSGAIGRNFYNFLWLQSRTNHIPQFLGSANSSRSSGENEV